MALRARKVSGTFENGTVKFFYILLAKFKKILYMGLRATLHFRKSKVALNPMYRIFLNFAKSCVLSCLSNVDNIKKFHRAVFEL